ncbi:hypothetical protein [Clostridium gasigenes]|nr:hypothetical protein [Clostridium gasigenes]MBB6622906.1 hypothetical protein [Clostridium gasigenes]MBU3087676.1 hypothetical protein [Clostridium gasigenes]NKF06102.1 hypothetical protein [Clostridium gasigenes]QSW19177.1 hypothetical protein J1C67_16820 [Clostridium gasigenes]
MSKTSKEIKNNYKNMMKIDDKYEDLVTNIVCYIRVELTAYDAEEAINDINEILLGAQDRGENLFEIIGDYKEFCKEVIASYKDSVKNYKLKMLIDHIPNMIYAIVFFFALDIVILVLSSKPNELSDLINIKYTITLAPIMNSIIALIVAIGVLKFIAKSSSEKVDNKKSAILFFIAYVLITISFVIIGLLGRKVQLITLDNISIPIIIAFLIVIVSLVSMVKIPLDATRGMKKSRNRRGINN